MIQTMITILVTVFVFGIIIMIHEMGHFIAAKLFGVQVNEFSLGMGPTLYRKQKGETNYQLRLLPIGGFVAMEGENEESSTDRAFCNKAPWKRLIILVAGATMNLILGLILLGVLTGNQALLGTRVIAEFHENSVSSQWLKPNDVIEKVNGYNVNGYNDVIFQMVRDQDGEIDFEVERDGALVELKNVAFRTVELEDGLRSMELDFTFFGVEKTFFTSVKYTFHWTTSVVKQVWYSLGDLITGRFGLNQLSGPVGTSTAIGQAVSQGSRSFILLIAFITINVGVFNLLPIPALDGGRLLFIFIEMILRRPIPPKYENYIHAGGFVLLMGLILVVTFNDILKLIF